MITSQPSSEMSGGSLGWWSDLVGSGSMAPQGYETGLSHLPCSAYAFRLYLPIALAFASFRAAIR